MSATTPEARTKKKIKEVLDKYKEHHIYIYMPVPGGYGKPTLDYLCFVKALGFAIEAKADGEKPTPRQEAKIEEIERSSAKVFVINDQTSLDILDQWLSGVCNS